MNTVKLRIVTDIRRKLAELIEERKTVDPTSNRFMEITAEYEQLINKLDNAINSPCPILTTYKGPMQ